MNQIIITGRLTANPELKQTQNGTSVCRFAVAVSRNYNRQETDFLDVTAWRQEAEFVASHFTKGQSIAVVGEVNVQTYDQNGQKRRAWQIVASRVEFCGGKNEQGGGQQQTQQPQPTAPAPAQWNDQGSWNAPAQVTAPAPAAAPAYGQTGYQQAGWNTPTTTPAPAPVPAQTQQTLQNSAPAQQSWPGFDDMTAFDDPELPF